MASLVLVGFSVTHPAPERFELPPTLTANLTMEPKPQPVREERPVPRAQQPAPAQPKPQPRPEPQPQPAPQPKPAPTPQPTPQPQPAAPVAQPKPQPAPTPAPQPTTPAPAQQQPINTADVFDDMLAGLDDEDSQLERQQEELAAAQAQIEKDAQVTATYSDLISQQIMRAWNRPMELQLMDLTGRETVVQVSLLPTGELLSAEILSSSGIAALDQSAIRAVQRVRRYQVPEDSILFNRNFRSFRFRFKPEDLMK
ncbi:TonB family protein [Saccharospirillum mangrovi]|uniref:TonB family protein n=1 Tax=Saccharospirillum mangrovi TaxID=2161747 RepID=UPI0013004C87|nr:TonB family protein [Saccharospirillum mangrovi]